MAYEDDKKTTFPTRFGTPTGSANERTMLDELSGVDGIRHRSRLGPDGVLTHVKTRGGHPHFWNEPVKEDSSEVFSLYLDSGAIDLLSVSPFDPRSGESSPVYYSTYQQQYYANNRLLGKIAPPDTAIRQAPANGTAGESFEARDGADLLGKKDCAAKCPPSMFTGKARLYAQAQLGAPIGNWKWSLDEGAFPPRWVHENGFGLDINTGVYTDSENTHWLVQIRGDGVIVTKLAVAKGAKPLVPMLGTPTDRTQIEAYVLSVSTPSTTTAFARTVNGLPPPSMLGYGWKFNWNGSRADIIKHVEGSPKHESTHYRLTINRSVVGSFNTESDRWTFTISTVEGPVYWHNTRFADVICHPTWETGALFVFGTRFGGHIGDAPIYCFYKENDELEVIRYSGSGGETNTMRSGVSDPACWSLVFDWTTDPAAVSWMFEGGTYGLDGGYGERRTRTNNPATTGFHSSGVNCVRTTQSYSYSSFSISAKSLTGNYHVTSSGIGHWAYAEEGLAINTGFSALYTASDGIVGYTSGIDQVTNTGELLGYAVGADTFSHEVTCSRAQYSGTVSENKYSLVVIPFYDAEAAYIHCHINTSNTATGTGGTATGYAAGCFILTIDQVFQVDYTTPVQYWRHTNTYYLGGGSNNQPSGGEDPLPPINESTDVIVANRVISRSGDFAFDPPVSLNVFFSGDETIGMQFPTMSAIHGPMYGYGARNTEGITHTFESPTPFIGWA